MFEIPDACPTSSAETTAVDADDAGPLASPSPTAVAASGATNTAYVHEALAKPTATAFRDPIFTASGVMSGVTAIMAAAAGSVARPASSAFRPNPSGSWK